jgi:hypothetical protein
MVFDEADKSFLTKRLILAWTGVFLLALLVTSVVAYEFAEPLRKMSQKLFGTTAAHSGDTPVVLVGGSLVFRARDTGLQWSQVSTSPATFKVMPQYDVQSIVVKKKKAAGGDDPDPDDSTAATDKLRVDVSNASSWKVDEYISPPSGSAPGTSDILVASITPDPNVSYQINLTAQTQTGFWCLSGNNKSVTYSLNQGCPDTVTFSKITISVTVGGQTVPWGTLNCVDANNDALGKCRIVFRGD